MNEHFTHLLKQCRHAVALPSIGCFTQELQKYPVDNSTNDRRGRITFNCFHRGSMYRKRGLWSTRKTSRYKLGIYWLQRRSPTRFTRPRAIRTASSLWSVFSLQSRITFDMSFIDTALFLSTISNTFDSRSS